MKQVVTLLVAIGLTVCSAYAADTNSMSEAVGFVRQVVQSLIEGEGKAEFLVADKVFAIDNGETLSKADFQKAWPEFAKKATIITHR